MYNTGLRKVFKALKLALEEIISSQKEYRKITNESMQYLIQEIHKIQKDNTNLNEKITKMYDKLSSINDEYEKQTILIIKKHIQSEIEDFHNKINDKIERMACDLQNSVIKNTSEDVYKKIPQYLEKEVGMPTKKNIYEDFNKKLISENIDSKVTLNHNEDVKQPENLNHNDTNIENPISIDGYAKKNIEHDTGRVIKKIDTNAIRRRILDAIEEKNSRKLNPRNEVNMLKNLSNDNEDMKTEENDFKDSVNNIISKVKFGLYKLPCFFDGENIFGIYNADHGKAIMQSGMNEELMLSSPRYLEKIHIWPECENLPSNKADILITKTDECVIHYPNNGVINSKTAVLQICSCCLDGVYKDRHISKNMSQFIDDFLTSKILY